MYVYDFENHLIQAGGITYDGEACPERSRGSNRVMALAGHVSGAMMERYSHIRMEAKRRAVDDLSGTGFEPGVAQNWAQFLVSAKSDANSLQ